MILKGESAEEFNRKADENYEKFKARQKQALIDMMKADEKLGRTDVFWVDDIRIDTNAINPSNPFEYIGLYDNPKKLYTIEDIERCVENWGLCKVEREYIEKFLETNQNK